MPFSTKAVAFQISPLLCFSEKPGGFVEIIISQFVQKRKAASSGIACRFVAFVESALNMRPTYT
nr:MAG TPA: hypothetical protein [Caudoviricetes sp.]